MMHLTTPKLVRALILCGLLTGCAIDGILPGPLFAQSYDNTNVLIESAVNHIYQKRYDKAHESLKKAYEQAPRHPGVHFNLARLFELTGNFSEAQKEYQMAAMLDPTLIAARRGMARVSVELKRQGAVEIRSVLDQTARDRQAVEVTRTGGTTNTARMPEPPATPIEIAEPEPPQVAVSLPAMKPTSSLPPTDNLRLPPLPAKVAETARKQPKSSAEESAEALLERGKTKETIELVQSLLESQDDNPRLHFLLGKALGIKGDLFGAIKHLEEAIKVDEHFYAAYYLLAQDYARVNLLDDSIKNYQIYFGVKPQAGVAVEMARIYERMGRSDMAQEFYGKANAMNPGNTQIQSRLTSSQGEVANNLYLRANHAFTLSDFKGAAGLYQQALVSGGLNDTYRRDAERKIEIARMRSAQIDEQNRPAREGFQATRKIYGTVNLKFDQLHDVSFQTRFTEPVTVEWRGYVARSFSRYGRHFLLMIKDLSQDELDSMGRDRNDFRLNPNFNNQPLFLLVADKGNFPPFAAQGKMITFTGTTDWKKYDILNELGQTVKLPAFEFITGHP